MRNRVCSFLVVSLSGFGIKVMLTSLCELGRILSYSVFWERLCGIGVFSFLNVGKFIQ